MRARLTAASRIALAALLGLAACDLPPAAQRPGDPGRGSASQDLRSLEAEAVTQVYYQFVDARGTVRFVSTLAEVPPEWRDRVGFVEMSSPPPSSPAEAQRARSERMARMPSRVRTAASSDASAGASGRVEIILYSADWCGACRSAKRYMDSKGIDYDERDVDQDRFKDEMLAKAGPGGIPVFDVEGQILRGFSPQRLEQLIQDAS